MSKMNSLSNFKQYLESWDLSIESLDDHEEREKFEKILNQTIAFLNQQMTEWETKSIEKDPSGEELLKLFKHPKYKGFKMHSDNLIWLRYRVKDLFEIKNRRTRQNFELKAELAELKLQRR